MLSTPLLLLHNVTAIAASMSRYADLTALRVQLGKGVDKGKSKRQPNEDVSAAPWVMLMSRCFRATGGFLDFVIKELPESGLGGSGNAQQGKRGAAGGAAAPGRIFNSSITLGSLKMLLGVTSAASTWLLMHMMDADHPGWGSGRDIDEIIGRYNSAETALIGAMRSCPETTGEVSRGVLVNKIKQVVGVQLPEQLQGFGTAVAAQLPLLYCCNNLGCTNLGGLSEVQLVRGICGRCSQCGAARYCGRSCQVEHWKEHKGVCKKLKEAAS